MTNKYIITNCPVCYDDITMCGKTLKLDPYTKESTWINCKDCTDCLLKQIVEKCYEKVSLCKECSKDAIFDIDCIDCTDGGKRQMAEEILSTLEIQECE